jgi:NADH-quinone oxidoreductase subunit N
MNKEQLLHDLIVIMPELLLAVLSLVGLMLGVIYTKTNRPMISIIFIAILALTCFMFYSGTMFYGEAFGGSFTNCEYTIRFKSFLLAGISLVFLAYIGYAKDNISTEFTILILLSSIGGFVAISSRDLITLFVGLELQSLPAYILAAFARDNVKSSEAGLKYFVLGALASAILLFGGSLIYGFTGSVSYIDIGNFLMHTKNIGVIVGISMILVAMMFKMSAAPFHMWTPDVYEGAPIIAVALFSSVQKLAITGVLVAFIALTLGRASIFFVPILKCFAVLSLFVGAFGAVLQTSIKRLMAYSTILNSGYILLAIIADISLGVWRHAFFTYMVIYGITTIGFFAILAGVFGNKSDDLSFKDLAGFSNNNKLAGAILVILISSMIGIPPLAGFFGKYYVLYDLINIEEYGLAILAVVASVVAAFYYLKMIKAMYFDEAIMQNEIVSIPMPTMVVASVIMIFIVCFAQNFAEFFNNMKFVLCI